MLVKYHIVIGLIVSILIFLLFPQVGWFYALIIFLSSFLIDFDHYLWFIYKKRDINPLRAVKFFYEKRDFFLKLKQEDRDKYKNIIMIFHGIECWILLALLILVHKIFLFVLIGIGIHMTLDFIEIHNHKRKFHIKFSQVYTHIKNKNLREVL